jgi:ABC-type polysaccharide/polyol phosphate transport system ATPase subunit
MEKAIEFNSVWKKFKKGRKLLLKEALLDIFKPGATTDFWVLKDVSFAIEKGETVGIIGKNGSGKSTILKLIAGVLTPTKGEVKVNGTIAPLIELGAGFHPELSGRENIYLNGVILGLSVKQIDKIIDDVIRFSELEDFVDTPVKHYSSGMYMRLGFAVAVHTNPEILLVDEILAVGDSNFQRKSFNKMRGFKKRGKTIVLISHNLRAIEEFCNKTIYIKDGKVEAMGETKEVIDMYIKDLNINTKDEIGKDTFK